MLTCRKSFTDTLLALAREDKDIVAVTTDARGSVTLGEFADELPGQFVECGIAEQDAIGISAGLASCGKKVFCCGPACFYVARSLEQVTAYCANGIAHEADMDAVKVEQIKSRQQAIALENNRAAYRRMLALFVGTSADSLHVVKPTSETNSSSDIRRPELDWYQAQEQRIAIQEQNLKAAYMPRFSLFAQGGYANPGLNMLKDDFQAYYVVGARLSWNFGSLYTLKNDRRKLDAERRMVQSNAETFLFNTRLQLTEKDAAIESLRKQMQEDDEMIRLQSNIRRAAEVKTANGTLSVIDMLQEINKESQARQNKVLHEVQLLLDIYQRKYLTNQ